MTLIILIMLFALGCSVVVFAVARYDRPVQAEIDADLDRWSR